MTAPGPLHICCDECELAVFVGLPCASLTLLHRLASFPLLGRLVQHQFMDFYLDLLHFALICLTFAS